MIQYNVEVGVNVNDVHHQAKSITLITVVPTVADFFVFELTGCGIRFFAKYVGSFDYNIIIPENITISLNNGVRLFKSSDSFVDLLKDTNITQLYKK